MFRSEYGKTGWVRLTVLSVTLVGLLAAGCTTSSQPNRSGSSACAEGKEAPIDEKTLTRAFSAEGIRLHRDDRCLALPGTLVSLSSISDEEIDVLCEIYPSDAAHDSNRIQRFVWLNDPTPTHLDVLNVSCGVFTEATAETDVVERALRRLPGVSAAPTTLPSEDAVRD